MTTVRRALFWNVAIAVILSIVPTMIAPDLLVRQEEPILATDARIRAFRVLVLPVERAYGMIGDHGGYHFLIDPPEFANFAPRPSNMAVGHVLRAVPFWFITMSAAVFSVCVSVGRLRKRTGRS